MKTTADLISNALVNARLAYSQLEKALASHSTPNSTHAGEIVNTKSDLGDLIKRMEKL